MHIREAWIKNTEFHPVASEKVLEKVEAGVKDALSRGTLPIVVFDLDSTLFDVAPRSYKILKEWIEHPDSQEFSDTLQHLRDLKPQDMVYSLQDVWEAKKISVEDEPYLTHFKHAKQYWRKRLLSHDYLNHDVPTEGGLEFVNKLYDLGAKIVYLTGRDIPAMGFGTFDQLKDHGLPIEKPRTRLILKPKRYIDDVEFKSAAAKAITEMGEVIASFENEPKNLVAMAEVYLANTKPGAFPTMNIFMQTVCSDNAAPAGKGIYRIEHFRMKK